MPRPPFFGINPLLEMALTLIVIIICLLIYFRTKDLYELSLHKGIKYFRFAFLFFAFAFALRFIFPITMFLFNERLFRSYTGFLMTFVGMMAILCILYSLLWKKLDSKNNFYIIISIAIIISFITTILRVGFLILSFQIILFILIVIISYWDSFKSRKRKKYFKLSFLYTLLFFAWFFDITSHFAFMFSLNTKLTFNIISICLFLIIYYKVYQKTKVKKK